MIFQQSLKLNAQNKLGLGDPVELGIIYSKTPGDNIADYTVVNPNSPTVSFTPSGTDLILSGTNGTGGVGASDLFEDYILLNVTDFAFTCLPKWKVRVNLTTGTINIANSFGFGTGVVSSNTFELIDSICRIGMDTGFVGQVSIYYGDTKAKGINDQTQPGGTHALSSSTEYWFEFERDEQILLLPAYLNGK